MGTLNREEMCNGLREFRVAAGLTQADAALALEWSASKMLRIENGKTYISVTDMRTVLASYNVENEDVVAAFVDAAREYQPNRGRPQRGPMPLSAEKKGPPLAAKDAAHFALLRTTNCFVNALLQAAQRINANAASNSRAALARSIDELSSVVEREGANLKAQVTQPARTKGGNT